MSILFGKEWTRKDLLRRIGRLQQVGGVTLCELDQGKERGCRIAEVKTGSGLSFSILLDRAMDIGAAEFGGIPLSWQSSTGFSNPAFFYPYRDNWLRTFGGGLVTTCGLSNVGAPNVDSGEELTLHGLISGSPAEQVKVDYRWHGDDLDITVEGILRETKVFGPNLVLKRLIWTRLGEKKVFLEDRVTNEGFEPTPLMFLYHINIGWPILDQDTMLIMPSRKAVLRDHLESGSSFKQSPHTSDYGILSAPQKGFREQVYFHDMIADSAGYVQIGVVHPNIRSSCFGIYIKYPLVELPRFTQWKMLGEGMYVLGIEPGNCGVMGRERERKDASLQFLAPGESKDFHLEIGAITTPEELNQVSDLVDDLLQK